MLQKNDVLTVTCESIGTNGEGIARSNGTTFFIPYLLTGERARVKVLKVKGSLAYAKVEELLTPAEDRVRPACPVFARCGGCQLQHMAYRLQLRFKTALVRDTLKKLGGVTAEVSSCERSEAEYGYRNKLQLPIGTVNGKNVVGFYAERSHRIVDTDVCPIHPDWAQPLIAAVKKFMEKCGLDGYDEVTHEGQLRHIVVRQLGKKFLITLVTTEREIKGIDYFLFLLDDIFPAYSFYLNFNDRDTNVVFGEEFKLLKGPGVYERTEGGITYEAGANTFLQVNEGVRGKLYSRAVSFAGPNETVIDCYAGGGLMTAMFAKKAKKAYGIEIVPEAHEMADRLKERNGLSNMENLLGKVEDVLPPLLEKEKDATVVLDPPRAGVERSVLKAILASDIKKLVMISSNPATLARDLGLLTGTLVESENGELLRAKEGEGAYEIVSVQPFDMFPQTKWVETLVLLSHKEPDSHISVNIEFGEGEGQISLKEVEKRAEARKPKEKVTYKMIQQYIEENYGFKVHTAYIAEVKRSLGLPMYDAPNVVEELKHPRPHPTKRMVAAIKETLAHFDFI